MNTLESAPHGINLAEDVSQKIRDLLNGSSSNNYNLRQIQLIVEKYVDDNPDMAPIDNRKLDEILMAWANSESSSAFSRIVHDPLFKTHPRFQGDIAKITLKDVQYYVETKKIPES